jgi:hypothetical protein
MGEGSRSRAAHTLDDCRARICHLIATGLTAELQHGFDRLIDTRRADRIPARFESTKGADWQRSFQ